jgi:hypothetical protein
MTPLDGSWATVAVLAVLGLGGLIATAIVEYIARRRIGVGAEHPSRDERDPYR